MVVDLRKNDSIMSKEAFTELFLDQAGLSTSYVNIKLYMTHLWFNSSKRAGLRLKKRGYDFLTKTLLLKSYTVPFIENMDMTPNVMIFLSHYMECPYYLNNNSITVFSERKSIELYLFSGDIRRIGLVKALNRQRELPTSNI